MTMWKSKPEIAYELKLLQFRPDVTSEETLNIGVVAFSPESQEFRFRITHRYNRLTSAFPNLDGPGFRRMSGALATRCREVSRGFDSDKLGLFRGQTLEDITSQVIVPGSSNFSWSSMRLGVCEELESRVQEVYEEYVGRMEQPVVRDRTDDHALWRKISTVPRVSAILQEIQSAVELSTDLYSHEFDAGWMNGTQQVVEAISLDYLDAYEMLEKAVKCSGVLGVLRESNNFMFTAIVTDRPEGSHGIKYDQAIQQLERIPNIREVIPESSAERFGMLVEQDLRSHR